MAVSSHLKHLDDKNFAVETAHGLVLVDFFAEWCGPCHMQTPILEKLATELNGKVIIGKLDIDKSQQTSATFQVASVPTLVLLKDGREIKRFVGVRDAESLKAAINGA